MTIQATLDNLNRTRLDPLETSSHFHEFRTLICNDCGYQYKAQFYCGNRLCHFCAKKTSWRLNKRYGKIIKNMREPKLLTLTLPTTPSFKKSRVSFIRKSFSKLRRRKPYVNLIRGGLYSIEIKKSGPYWNVHIHVLIDSSWLSKLKLINVWNEITQSAFIVNIKKAWSPSGGLKYILKYIEKPPHFKNRSDADIFRETMKGVRLIQDFGLFYNCSPKVRFACPDCGCNSWDILEFVEQLRMEGWGGVGPIP